MTAKTTTLPESVREIFRGVSEEYGIPVEWIYGKSRRGLTSRARQRVMRQLYEELGYSYSEVGKLLGRDHTTCIHGIRADRARDGLVVELGSAEVD